MQLKLHTPVNNYSRPVRNKTLPSSLTNVLVSVNSSRATNRLIWNQMMSTSRRSWWCMYVVTRKLSVSVPIEDIHLRSQEEQLRQQNLHYSNLAGRNGKKYNRISFSFVIFSSFLCRCSWFVFRQRHSLFYELRIANFYY